MTMLGSQACTPRTDYKTQRPNKVPFFHYSSRDSLYCPLRLKQLQLPMVEESTANVPDRISSAQLEHASSSGFCYQIWCGLLTGVRYILQYITFLSNTCSSWQLGLFMDHKMFCTLKFGTRVHLHGRLWYRYYKHDNSDIYSC